MSFDTSQTSTLHTPTDAIAAFSSGDIGRNRLFEALAKHDNWLLPLQQTPDGPAVRSFKGEDGALFCVLFTGREAMNLSLEAEGTEAVGDTVQELKGTELFTGAVFSDAYDWVLIDPDGPAALKLTQEHFPGVREWAGMYRLDDALVALQRDDDAQQANLERLQVHTPWIVVASGPDKRLALVPDAEQRQLGAVFTSFNAADRYVQALAPHLAEGVKLQPVIFPADKLFAELSRLDIMGAVVNCFGPTPGRAFSKAFIDSVAAD